MRDLEFWRFALDSLETEPSIMLLAVVAHTEGSPGRRGFKMLATLGGRHYGTIGGGIMEHKLVRQAEQHLRKEDHGIYKIPQHHNNEAPADRSGMICAGSQLVLMCPLTAKRKGELQQVVERLASGGRVGLVIDVTDGVDFVPAWARQLHAIPVATTTESLESDTGLYRELLGPEIYLHIVGAGHVGLALSRVMAKLNAHLTVFDHRCDLATLREMKDVHRFFIGPYAEMGAKVREGEDSYAAVVSTSAQTDEAALKQLCDKKLRYLGVMGSPAKVRHLMSALAHAGFSPAQLARVHAPIGLDIGSQTPAEIAISIAAEIIRVKNQACLELR